MKRLQDPPIFPLATVETLDEEIAATERAIDRLGEGIIIDRDQMDARRHRLEWWLARMRSQRAAMLEQVVV